MRLSGYITRADGEEDKGWIGKVNLSNDTEIVYWTILNFKYYFRFPQNSS